jgi:hypothetical protein
MLLPEGTYAKAKKYLEEHVKDSEASKKLDEAVKAGPCITLSRQVGAGSREVARILIKILEENDKKKNREWALFDKTLIEKVIEDNDLPTNISKFLNEERQSEINSLINEYLAGSPGTWSLIQKLSGTILRLAEIGNSIIIGRGSNIITSKLTNVFHVRFVASPDDRIRHVQNYYGFRKNEAIEFIEKDNISRRKFLQTNFNKNIDDPTIYHLVINTSLMGYSSSAKLIADAVINMFPMRMGIT